MADKTKTPLTVEFLAAALEDMGLQPLFDIVPLREVAELVMKHAPEGAICEELVFDALGRLHFTRTPMTYEGVYKKMVEAGIPDSVAKAQATEFMKTPEAKMIPLECFRVEFNFQPPPLPNFTGPAGEA